MRWGIAGPGAISTRFTEAMRLVDGGSVVAVASRSGERAAEFARYPPGHAEGYGDAFRVVLRDAYLAMAGEPHGSYPTFADGHRGMQVLEATLHSARDGGWASVET